MVRRGREDHHDRAAYEALSRHERDGQSFSDVIKRHFGAGRTARDLLDAIERDARSAETADRIEDQRRSRRRSPARAVRT